jgi:pimeloyl-ACP methyl ester carboxylesterase
VCLLVFAFDARSTRMGVLIKSPTEEIGIAQRRKATTSHRLRTHSKYDTRCQHQLLPYLQVDRDAKGSSIMATYVLVAGAWLGGWAWADVTRRLRQVGHEVYPVTLTGLGERKHLARPEVGLETHITDIVNVIEAEDLRDVVLVGHSYSGVPITGVADRLPERIASVVYVDSGPIPADTTFIEFDPASRASTEQLVASEGDGWLLPPLSEDELAQALAELTPEQRIRLWERMTPQPFATYTEPLRLTNPAREALPKVAILNSFPEAAVRQMIADGHPMGLMLAGPEWRYVELLTSHWPMFTRPDDLAAALADLAPSSA